MLSIIAISNCDQRKSDVIKVKTLHESLHAFNTDLDGEIENGEVVHGKFKIGLPYRLITTLG